VVRDGGSWYCYLIVNRIAERTVSDLTACQFAGRVWYKKGKIGRPLHFKGTMISFGPL
jgi:hypothetical protein